MKHLIVSLTLLSTCISFSQDYLPMLQEGNAWSVDTFYCPFSPPDFPTWTVTDQITINGTVEINGELYKQIYKDENPSCLLREENGIVYKYFPDDNEEKIFFNMNLEIGDTYNIGMDISGFNHPYCSGGSENEGIFIIEVFEIDTLFIAGENRKVIRFLDEFWPQGGEVMAWVEGMGTGAGLGHIWPFEDVTCWTALSCFTTNGVTYFMGNATSCDNTTLSLGETYKDKIVLYPNPISERSILQLPNEAEINQLKIYNISGKLIKDIRITSDNYILNNMDYASGLYFYQVSSNGVLIKTEKFIVK